VNQYQKTFETNKGRTLSFDKVYIATGPTPNSSFLEKHYPQVLDNRKQIQVLFYFILFQLYLFFLSFSFFFSIFLFLLIKFSLLLDKLFTSN